MGYLRVKKENVNPESLVKLLSCCPFNAISYEDGEVKISSACRVCKLCVKKGGGIMEFCEDDEKKAVDKSAWRGITVYADIQDGEIHKVTFELIGKAKELAKVTGHPVYVLVIGNKLGDAVSELSRYGADKIFVYDDERFKDFRILSYADAFTDFINKIKPSSILVGATNVGRALAPRVAARFRTGLTADCTLLEMKENTDLVQIRPAFGGNIMAQIITTFTRPQFCTVRYKIFDAPARLPEPYGEVVPMTVDKFAGDTTEIIKTITKKKERDISDADVIVAVGRGVKSKADLDMCYALADVLGAEMACTRPLIENGFFDARRQIGLSGRTVKPKLIITLGVSGSVQFAAGMKSSDLIIAVNNDKNASIFDIAHIGIIGDLYEIVPALTEKIREARK